MIQTRSAGVIIAFPDPASRPSSVPRRAQTSRVARSFSSPVCAMNGSSPILDLRGPSRADRRAGDGGGSYGSSSLSPFAPALGAASRSGDFGRPKQSFWNDVILPTAGSKAARVRGEAVSGYPFTDAEDELRDRSWRFLMPAHERRSSTIASPISCARAWSRRIRPVRPGGLLPAAHGRPSLRLAGLALPPHRRGCGGRPPPHRTLRRCGRVVIAADARACGASRTCTT